MTAPVVPQTAEVEDDVTVPGAARRSPLRTVLLAVIAVGLVLLGGGLAVALGIGRTADPTVDSVDAGFSRDMARHHLQGVEMANLVAERSQDPEIRQLAFDISAAQTNQAGRMQGWLALWGLPTTGGDTMAWMSDSGSHAGHDMPSDGALMPGMATEEELANLRQLSGTAFDVEFLRLMIRHHQGGRDMAEYAAEHAQERAVRELADTMAQTQTAETGTMTDMLAARGGTPLPAP
ncbi:DUF305 domain-containing protein [Blastococcus mobilis]|uniref:Uncharacterized conserved protein, DUF305 family n=1 Tax=Blastococcus mobilis TaxID=1938746 RepID=A0A238WE19_9ACTN|nr:DUF305 domain-containing protein [Blastococcus mobilis]SNR44805.1 Uncharacterized conserved protein, DUF305 family [Blastococcus mobilis]